MDAVPLKVRSPPSPSSFSSLPSSAYTCSLSYKAGATCGPAVTRWYYDSTTRTCQTYSFNGCDGNSNNFATQQVRPSNEIRERMNDDCRIAKTTVEWRAVLMEERLERGREIEEEGIDSSL